MIKCRFPAIRLLLPVLLTALSLPALVSGDESGSAPAFVSASESLDEEDLLYAKNDSGFVDISMDISGGIPEDATGCLQKIREKGVLTVATEPYFAPQEFIDPSLEGQEQYVGSDIELAKRIAERMGVTLKIIPYEFSKVLPAVSDGYCDLAISALSYTPGRAASMTLSKPYHLAADTPGTGILIRKGNSRKIKSTEDLATRDIAAQSGSVQEMLLADNVLRYKQFRRFSTVQEVYTQVEKGLCDAVATDIETAELYIRNNPDCGLMLVSGISFHQSEEFDGDRIAAAAGEEQLIAYVNAVIDEVLASGEYEEWFLSASARAAELGL